MCHKLLFVYSYVSNDTQVKSQMNEMKYVVKNNLSIIAVKRTKTSTRTSH